MSEREDFIGTWVSEQEKVEVLKLAKGLNMSVSDLIRHRVIRPMMTLPEAVQNIKLYIDGKFKRTEYNITELIKEQLFSRKPIQQDTKEYEPIEITIHPIQKNIEPTEQIKKMTDVLKEMKKLVKNGELILETTPKEEVERERAKTDPIAYLEWKAKQKK